MSQVLPGALNWPDQINDEESGFAFVIDDGPVPEPLGVTTLLEQTQLGQPMARTTIGEQPRLDNPVLRAALAHASMGRPVLSLHWPLHDGKCSCKNPICSKAGKHPLTRHGLKDASTDPETIRGWWKTSPNANLGLITGGTSGLLVLDVDGEAGRASLAALTAQFGSLPDTTQSKTKRGHHIFFQYPKAQGIRGSVGQLGVGLDIRAEGGYVVIPPSRHQAGHYQWENRKPLADIPSWLLSKLVSPVTQHSSDSPTTDRIPKGQRNQTLTSLAGTMRKRGMTQEAIEAALLAENRKRCDPPLPDTEVLGITSSIARYSSGVTAAAPCLQPSRHSSTQVDEREAESEAERPAVQEFPDGAWRGPFSDYRAAMAQGTEASDVFHFATLWARGAVALGRTLHFPYGSTLYPNVFLVGYGPSGDRKTSAMRKVQEIGTIRIIHGGGSGEGLADDFARIEPGQGQ